MTNELSNMNIEADRNISCMVCGERFATIPESLDHEHFSEDAETVEEIPAVSFEWNVFPRFYVRSASGEILASGEKVRGFLTVWGAGNTGTDYRNERELLRAYE